MKIVGCFDPRNKNSYSVNVYMMAVHSFMSVMSLSSACVKRLEFADIRFILLVPWCVCKRSTPIPKLEATHLA